MGWRWWDGDDTAGRCRGNNAGGVGMKHILKCEKCNEYTMMEVHGCGTKTINVKPAKFSPEDQYGDYRRKAKREQWQKQGLA
jgi:H/ACA ribonucleoprotein complex subunit 3